VRLVHARAAGAEIDDFADTAAIMALLDLVIAVDTSIMHLASDGAADADAAPVRSRLELDARALRFALVSDDAVVPPAEQRRLASVFAEPARELRALSLLLCSAPRLIAGRPDRLARLAATPRTHVQFCAAQLLESRHALRPPARRQETLRHATEATA